MTATCDHLEADFTLLRGQFAGIRKRGAKRYRFKLAALGYLTFDDGARQEAWLVDLSETGIGFYADQPLQLGQNLSIKLPGPANSFIALAAKVSHSTVHEKGGWRIGCQFTTPVTPAILDELL